MSTPKISKTRYIVSIALFSALAFVLMVLEFHVPIVPSFLKFDFSEIPELIGTFTLGPVAGVIIALVKNLLHMPLSQTSYVGELANFLVAISMVIPAGLIYKYKRTRLGGLIGCLVASVVMSVVSLPINLYITYPFYFNFLPEEAIINMYKAIVPQADTLLKCLCIFNIPFTFAKGLIASVITFLVYKPISKLIKDFHPKTKKKVAHTDENTTEQTVENTTESTVNEQGVESPNNENLPSTDKQDLQ